MTAKEGFHLLLAELTACYGDAAEARSVARFLFEDGLNIRYPLLKGELEPAEQQYLAMSRERLLKGEPIQYVTGYAWFYGDRFLVSPAVLIPRPETEELVEWVLQWLKREGEKEATPRVLDIGTGSGCIAIEIKKRYPASDVSALDIQPDALALARKNAALFGVEVVFHEEDILDASSQDKLPSFDVLVSNPPYVLEAERPQMAVQVRDFEPGIALFVPDEDPLRFYKALGALAIRKLAKGGALFAECHYLKCGDVAALWESMGLTAIEIRRDGYGHERMVKAIAPL
ncbi:MAG: peptide chain release factor N(5)-glutamine methyltransferase [Saprospiraceae bacterium]|jgi:release factor glutamine methyltransferase